METFTVWHQMYSREERQLCFYASVANVQHIGEGSSEFIGKLLEDMGLGDLQIGAWKLFHFATDYISDHRDADDWEDRWIDTCEIRIDTEERAVVRSDFPGFIESYAWDESWSGERIAPGTCVVIADFRRQECFARAERLFGGGGALTAASGRSGGTDDLGVGVDGNLLAALRDAAGTSGSGNAITASACHEPRQLHVSMAADLEFYEQGAVLADAVRAVCEALGATTHWRDRET